MRVFRRSCGCIALAFWLAFCPVTGAWEAKAETGAGVEDSAAAWTTDETNVVAAQPEGQSAPVVLEEGGKAAYTVEVPSAGTYAIRIRYTAQEGKGANIGFGFALDGEYPYPETANLELPRLWKSVFLDDSVDKNQRKPAEEEVVQENSVLLADNSGKYNAPFTFPLSAGIHTLTIDVQTEKVSVEEIALVETKPLGSYAEYAAAHTEATASEPLTIEAERASLKSNKSILPLNDRTSPKTTPYHHSNVVYNSIGGDSWKMPGQWIEWTVQVEEAGLYCLDFRFKQSYKLNGSVYRKLYIDGEIPFAEAQALEFPYASGWQSQRLGDDDGSYAFYLSEGTHTLRLEVTTGEYAAIVDRVDALVTRLNAVYRQVLMITGISPDMYRDYEFEKLIPDTLTEMGVIADELRSVSDALAQMSEKSSGSDVSALQRLIQQLDNMAQDSTTIPKNFQNSDFQNNITSLASWIYTERTQPLELDSLVLSPPDTVPAKAGAGFWKTLSHYLVQYVYSYVTDYNMVSEGQAGNETITVWVPSGRDQAQILRNLTSDSELVDQGISANIQLIAAGSILPAVLAGTAPDVVLMQAQQDPVNFAIRNAVTDLSKFAGFDAAAQRFHESALEPFRYDGGVYALPETQTFPVLFVRTDVLDEIGVTDDDLETWDDILMGLLPKLQEYQLSFGLPMTFNSYLTMLYQNGSSLYNEEKTGNLLNSAAGVQAFTFFTEIYTDYRQPTAFDFANRFRSGEMPVAVSDYTAQNQLSVFAPEIKGQWEMRPLPGVRDGDTINRTVASTATGCVIMRASEHQEAAWKFLDWWTSTRIQTLYGNELETVMGTAARYNSANREAFEQLPWEPAMLRTILAQWEDAKALPEIPGGYYTSRYFDFATRDVITNGENPRETLGEIAKEIDAEIANKLEEINQYGRKAR